MTIRAAIYLRVSLDATGERLAVSRQRDACIKIAADRGWEIADEYVDNSVSASKRNAKRPEYDRMVEDFRAGHFSALVCWDLDRLTRQPRQLEDWIDAALDRGLLLTTANGEADLSTDGGRLFARIKAGVARSEIELKGSRQKAAAAQRADHGKPPMGVRLTGYTVRGDLVPVEAERVADVFRRFRDGESLREIAARLASEGVAPRHGGTWSPSSVRTILTNPRYAGRAIYRGKVTGQPGGWTAIVDDATFDAVQARLEDPRRITNRVGTDRKYLGGGLFRCGVCSGLLRSHSGGRYRCPVGGHVLRTSLSVDALVRAVIRRRLARADLADLIAPPADDRGTELAAEATALRQRLTKVEADYDDDLIDGRRYRVKVDKLTAQLKAVEQERARAAHSPALAAMLAEDDPAAAFDAVPLGVQRTVIDVLATVYLDWSPRGYKFNPATVRIVWNQPGHGS